ncbi:hypothetical protein [Streptomyces sp. NPDC046862]|uniref:hypothetical protein n=1 Tax=Streptomyces sp. NPDC046862 TaxID=3154603 RepID=UPI0034530055
MNGPRGAEAPARCFAGDFETHLTIGADPGGGHDEPLRRWARDHGLKYTRIVLDRGQSPDQPMVTCRGSGTLAGQRAAARAWVDRLRGDGFDVTRVKIEAAPWNDDVPRTRADAAALPPRECYFEHHIKLVLIGDAARLDSLRALVVPHAAHVSRNARRALDAGRHERFVTQRCRGVGRSEARDRLDALLSALADAGHTAVETEEEFVVHDDNPVLDAGWIDDGLVPGSPGRLPR